MNTIKLMRDALINRSTRYTREQIIAMDPESVEHAYKTEFYTAEDWEAE